MKIFYFTGTGNSLYIAKRLGGELYSIPQVLKGNNHLFNDEKIGIVFPTYGFSVPNIVKEFIEKVTLKSSYIFVIMTCSNTNGNSSKWITSFAKRNNIQVKYSNSISMTGNHIPLINIESEKLIDKDIESNIQQLISDISNSKSYINNGMLLGGLLRNALKVVNIVHPIDSPTNFSVNDKCIKCSTCIKVCPRANVSFSELNKVNFGNHYESCLACVHNCPVKAIKVKGDKNPKARYRNEHVSLKEIIASNKQ